MSLESGNQPGDHGRFAVQNPITSTNEAPAETNEGLFDKVLVWISHLGEKEHVDESKIESDT